MRIMSEDDMTEQESSNSSSNHVYSEPVFLHETARVASMASMSSIGSIGRSSVSRSDARSLFSNVSRTSRLSSCASTSRSSTLSSQMPTVVYRTKKTTASGFFKKRSTVIDCGAYTRLPNGYVVHPWCYVTLLHIGNTP